MVFFFVARLMFLLFHIENAMGMPHSDRLGVFLHGLWMDSSTAGYLLMLSALLIIVSFFSEKTTKIIFNLTTIVLLIFFVLIIMADIELYHHWSFRIDATPLFYLKTPANAAASAGLSTYLTLLLTGLLFAGVFYFLFRIFVFKIRFKPARMITAPLFLVIAAVAILPVRGGVGIAPMNPAKVYFSSHIFSNHASLNAVWNFLYSLSKSGEINKKYPEYMPAGQAGEWYDLLTESPEPAPLILNHQKPNIVFILLEGFTSKVIAPAGGMAGITPNFNCLAEEGLFFSNIYASGDRSNKGLVAVLSGFPAQSTQPVIKSISKLSKLATITGVLGKAGYQSTFYYGGDPDFSNIRAYLHHSGINRLVTKNEFPDSLNTSKWGVHDEHVFRLLLNEMDTARSPCFKMFFTLSSHEPFDIPATPAFSGNSEDSLFLSSIHYTDEWIGWFFDEAKKRAFWNNTLFVLIADHGHRLPGKSKYFMPDKFSIPMLWLGGALEQKGVVTRIGSQIDLAATLLFQLGLDAEEFRFSQNLLCNPKEQFAYYAFNDGFGFVTPGGYFVWDHIGQMPLVFQPNKKLQDMAFSWFTIYQAHFLGL
jgi:phosphoglycerol transferase MdoB-like AlkP superfamily enzyme